MQNNLSNEKMNMDQTLQDKLAALEALFEAKIPGKMNELSLTWNQYLSEKNSTEHMMVLHRHLHTLAGSAGSFGFIELGKRARALEIQINDLPKDVSTTDIAITQLGANLQSFITWCTSTPKAANQEHTATQFLPVKADASEMPIYVVDDDELLARDIAVQLEYFGYQVKVFNQLDSLSAAIAQQAPSVVIMDMMFGQIEQAGAAEISRLRATMDTQFPCIFMSTANTFSTRLAAVRAGGAAYFSKPVDILALTDRLDALTVKNEFLSFRILIVDDDLITADYYSTILKRGGMEIRILLNPKDIFSAISEFQPELILMDVYMPDCNGIELAKLIRQESRYLDIPIVFLSSEENFGKQLDAIKSGADDFLTKPIEPTHLISSLTSRGERHRALRSLIMRDGLTQLFNHSAIKEHLSIELSRAQRGGNELALVMIDLDYFKQVNDTYGHPVGDQVIRALSRLLQQRLRRCDMVGRYGGEEFVVVLPSTSRDNAVNVLNKIRDAFSKIRHHGNETEFSCNFSAGVVAMGETKDAEELFRAADAALYRAKKNGRNRIET